MRHNALISASIMLLREFNQHEVPESDEASQSGIDERLWDPYCLGGREVHPVADVGGKKLQRLVGGVKWRFAFTTRPQSAYERTWYRDTRLH